MNRCQMCASENTTPNQQLCDYCAKRKPTPPPASLGDEEKALDYAQKIHPNGSALVMASARDALWGMRTARAELLAEVKRLEEEVKDHMAKAVREIGRRVLAEADAEKWRQAKHTMHGEANLLALIKREALGAGHREGAGDENS